MNLDKISTLSNWIDKSDNITFFGGAGVSTESGIPDFRSKDGLYNQHDVQFDKYRPEYLLSHSCLMGEPKVYFEFHRQKMDTRKINPNNAHIFLAKLEERGKINGIVTQNIDGLHQKAGSKKVFEIHGSALRNYCTGCKKTYDENYIFDSKDPIPMCSCGKMIRPDITLYEEGLPDLDVDKAISAISNADMLIIGGTSLTVYPAASFINYFSGKYLVVINQTDLSLTNITAETLVIKDRIGEVFTNLAKLQNIEL